MLSLPLAIAAVLWLPLIVFMLRRDDTAHLMLRGLGGAIVAGVAATIYCFSASGGDMYWAILWFALMVLGAPLGAYLGVAIAEAVSSDSDRADGARRGLLYGFGVGVVLCVALALILKLSGGHLPHVLVGVALMSPAVGALFGSQMALVGRMPRPAGDAAHRWLTAGAVALVVLVLAVGAVHRLDREATEARWKERRLQSATFSGPAFEINNYAIRDLESPQASVRASGASNLTLYPDFRTLDTRVVPALVRAAGDSDARVRLAAVTGLAAAARQGHDFKNRVAVDALIELRDSPHVDVRQAVERSLSQLGIRSPRH